jgi:hypothetical protein
MNLPHRFTCVAIAASAIAAAGCGRHKQADASQPLTQSFQAAEPATKQAVQVVAAQLRSGNYAEVARSLPPILNQPNLTAQQKRALGLALDQMNRAVAENPALDTKEMYELRQRMFRAVDGGPRF